MGFLRAYFDLYAASVRGLPRATWALAFVALIQRAGTMVVPFLALYFTKSLGFSKAEAGELLALWGSGILVGSFLGGWLSDRFHPVWVQAAAMAGCGLGFFWIGQCESFVQVAIALVATGLVSSVFRPANATTLTATCPPELRSRAFALLRLALNFGMALGPSAGGVIAETSYAWLFWIDGTVCILSGLLVLGLLRGVSFDEDAPAPDATPVRDASPWRDRRFLVLVLVSFLNAYVMLQWFSTGPIFFEREYRMSESQIGLLFALNPVLIVLFEMVLIHRLRSRPPLAWVTLGSLLLATSCGMLTLTDSLVWCVITVVVWTFGEMLESPLLLGFVANRADSRQRGRYLGMMHMAFAAAYILTPLISTRIYEEFGPAAMWWLAAGVGGVATSLCWWVSRVERGEAPGP